METNKKLKRWFALVLASVMAFSMTVPVSANNPPSRYEIDYDGITAAQPIVTVPSGTTIGFAIFNIVGYNFIDSDPQLNHESFEVNATNPSPYIFGAFYSVVIDDDRNATLTVRVENLHGTNFGNLGTVTVTPSGEVSPSAMVAFYRPTHAVTFDLAGGTPCDVALKNQTVTHGDNATPPTVTRPGYNFAGWYPAGGYKNVTSDITITAQWTQIEIVVATTDVPRTGDDTQLPWLHLVMSLLAIGLGASVLFLLRKKKKGESNA